MLRVVVETRDHLQEAASAHRAAGLSLEDAELEAIAQFGPPDQVARQFARELGGRLSASGLLVRSLLHAGAFVGSVFVALGATGVLIAAATFAFDFDRVTGFQEESGQTQAISAIDCAELTRVASANQEVLSQDECARLYSRWLQGIGTEVPVFFHLLLTFGSLLVLSIGVAVVWAHQALLRWHAHGGDDRSAPAKAHALIGAAVYGYIGLRMWPGVVDGWLSSSRAVEYPALASALVTLAFFLSYARSLRTLTADPSRPGRDEERAAL